MLCMSKFGFRDKLGTRTQNSWLQGTDARKIDGYDLNVQQPTPLRLSSREARVPGPNKMFQKSHQEIATYINCDWCRRRATIRGLLAVTHTVKDLGVDEQWTARRLPTQLLLSDGDMHGHAKPSKKDETRIDYAA
eukprot:1770708-Amphidinium_carterae.1